MPAGNGLDPFGELVPDDEHGPIEAGASCIHEQVVNQRLVSRSHGLELFGAAKPRAYTCGHHNNRQCHMFVNSSAGMVGE
jgi:hypothetical protein